MRFDILTVLTLAGLATANRKPNPWDPLDVRGLKKCQAACVHSTLNKLGDGKFVILQTPNQNFCASPDLKQWLREDLFPCGAAVCGRKAKLYAKRGMKWLRNTCPTLTFTEAEFSQPAPQPAHPGAAPAGPPAGPPAASPAGPPAGQPAGQPAAEPVEGQGNETENGSEGQDDNGDDSDHGDN